MARDSLRRSIMLAGSAVALLSAGGTPDAVPADVRNHVAQTLAQGGEDRAIPRGMIRAVDINHDRVADWLVDYRKADELEWCGTGGCHYELFVSMPSGAHLLAFDEAARSLRVTAGGRVDADVYGNYCGSFGADSCFRSFAWSAAEAMLIPTPAVRQRPWLFGPLFSPVVTDRKRWPAAVASAVATRAERCAASGGSLDEANGAVVRSPDLDGDGRSDWIIGAPYSACVAPEDMPEERASQLPRPTLVVLSGAPAVADPLYVGPDTNYVVDVSTSPATMRIVPDEEARLMRCPVAPMRCGGRALRWSTMVARLVEDDTAR